MNQTSCSIHRCYNLFRTMGMRHVLVVDGELMVKGIITRADMNEHQLHHFWQEHGERMQKDMNVDSLPPAIVYPEANNRATRDRGDSIMSQVSVEDLFESGEIDPEIAQAMLDFEASDSPKNTLRKKI